MNLLRAGALELPQNEARPQRRVQGKQTNQQTKKKEKRKMHAMENLLIFNFNSSTFTVICEPELFTDTRRDSKDFAPQCFCESYKPRPMQQRSGGCSIRAVSENKRRGRAGSGMWRKTRSAMCRSPAPPTTPRISAKRKRRDRPSETRSAASQSTSSIWTPL